MPYNPPSTNQVITSTLLLDDVWNQVIAQVTSASRPTGAEGQVIYETDTGRYLTFNGSTWVQFAGNSASALNSYTSQIDQGASTNIAKTTVYSQYQIMGNLCYWTFAYALTAAGTAGSNVILSTPVTMSSTNTGLGVGTIYDASTTTRYVGMWVPSTTTTMRLQADGVFSGQWGATPNLALASGDNTYGSVWLPIA